MGKITECSSEFFTFLTTLFFQDLEGNGLMFRTLYIVKLDHPGFVFFFCFGHLYLRTLKFFWLFSAWTLWKRGCSAYFCTASASYYNVKWRDCTLKQMYLKAQGDHLWWCSHLCWSCPLTSMLTISIWRVRSECKGFKSLTALLLMIVSKSTIRVNEQKSGYYNRR